MSRVLVSIQGTGRIEADFWISQQAAIARHLGAPPQLQPVWWGGLIDAGARLAALRDQLAGRIQAGLSYPARSVRRLARNASDRFLNFVNGTAGVVAYFVPQQKQAVIRERLSLVLAELSTRREDII